MAGHPKAKLTADESLVDEENGVFLVDNSLSDVLRSKETAAAFLRYVFFPFCKRYSFGTCQSFACNPKLLDEKFGSSIVKDTAKFVARISGEESRDGRGDEGLGETQRSKLAIDMHALVPNAKTAPRYKKSRRTLIPGAYLSEEKQRRSGAGPAKSRATHFGEVVEKRPWLWGRHNDAQFRRLDVDLARFETLYDQLGGASVFGENVDSRITLFDKRNARQPVCAVGDHADLPGGTSAVADALWERVDKRNLITYAEKKVDRRQELLDEYVNRVAAAGIQDGHLWKVRVEYYRPRGAPGGKYAIGPSLQKLTREARAHALGGFAFDVDIKCAQPRTLAII